MSHTPKPWRAVQRPHTKGPPSQSPEDAHLDYFHIQAGQPDSADSWEISGYMRPEDAHLITTAPDLLEIVRDFTLHSGSMEYDDWHALFERAQAVLTKAEGK